MYGGGHVRAQPRPARRGGKGMNTSGQYQKSHTTGDGMQPVALGERRANILKQKKQREEPAREAWHACGDAAGAHRYHHCAGLHRFFHTNPLPRGVGFTLAFAGLGCFCGSLTSGFCCAICDAIPPGRLGPGLPPLGSPPPPRTGAGAWGHRSQGEAETQVGGGATPSGPGLSLAPRLWQVASRGLGGSAAGKRGIEAPGEGGG